MKMSVNVICIASGPGMPIFSRKKGNTENFPFSIMGSLSGVHLFTKSQAISLLNTLTNDYCIVWKEYFESILLIGISSGCTQNVLEKLLTSVLNAMILGVSLDEIKSIKNVEKIKRDLRVIYPIIDKLLDCIDCGDSNNSSDLISFSETILCNENQSIKGILEQYTECIQSVYACVLIHGKIAAATEEFWELNSEELKLIAYLATLDTTSNTKDYAIFLPYKSPNVAYRLITCTLISDVYVCCLAGQNHNLEEVEISTTHCFKNNLEMLTGAVQCFPRNIPETLHLDPGILSLLLVSKKQGKYVISSTSVKKRAPSNCHRVDILRTFFYRSVFPLFGNVDKNMGTNLIAKETYCCSEYHKCYATLTDDNILCIMYNSTIPNFAMKHIAEKVLKIILNDKFFCW